MHSFILLHDQNGHDAAPDCEIWLNPAHVVTIAPIFGSECATVALIDRRVITTVESYLWIIEKLTGHGLDRTEKPRL